jgi:putative membrane protein
MGSCCGGLGWGGWGGMGVIGPILSLVVFAGVLAVLGLGTVWVVRKLGQGGATMTGSRPMDEALDIARRRLAAGEITAEEFEEIRDRLRG